MTPTLARMVAERANGLKKPIRWFSIPQLFRYERQQRGRLREHFQLNCDLIGEPGPLADAEIIALGIDVMRALGLGAGRRPGPALRPAAARGAAQRDRCRRRGCMELGVPGTRQAGAFGARGSPEGAGGRGRFATAAVAVPGESARHSPPGPISRRGFPRPRGPGSRSGRRCPPSRRWVSAISSTWISRSCADWRTTPGTVFELFDAQRSFRAICGGGRYDDLLDRVGGVRLSAVGFGMGDVVLGELLKERGRLPKHPPSVRCLSGRRHRGGPPRDLQTGPPASRSGTPGRVRPGRCQGWQPAQAGRCPAGSLCRGPGPRRARSRRWPL